MSALRQRLKVKWKTDDAGEVSLVLTVPNVQGPMPDAFGKRYWLADCEEELPVRVRCGLVDVKPKVVLKVFCPVPKRLVRANQKERQRLARADGSRLLMM